MSTTISLSVREARKRLADTSRLNPEQVNELEQIVARFYGSRPSRSRQCVACSVAVWEERTSKDSGDSVWCCGGCGRSAALSAAEWDTQRQAAEAVRQVQDAAAAAAVPDPRAALAEALAKLAEARKALSHTEDALPTARSTLVAAQLKHDRAEADAADANGLAASHLADSIQGKRPAGPAPSVAAARAALATAVDGLVAAKNARVILDSRLADARSAVGHATDRARRAALRVLAAEHLEDLIEVATESRATYLQSITGLTWLIRSGAIPSGDIRPNQLVREGDTPPSTWREAQNADGGMTARLAALMEGAP